MSASPQSWWVHPAIVPKPTNVFTSATVGVESIGSMPTVLDVSNMFYFKAYGGDSTDGGNVVDFLVADPAGSSAFSLDTKKFTAPTKGLYRFAAVCYSAYDSWTHVSLRRVRGEQEITLQYVAIKDDYESQGFSTEVFLEEGDQVYLYCDDGRLRLADYSTENFTLDNLTYQPRTTFEGRLVYKTA